MKTVEERLPDLAVLVVLLVYDLGSAGLSSWLSRFAWATPGRVALLCLLIVALLLCAFNPSNRARRWLMRRTVPIARVPKRRHPPRCKGLILMVSPQRNDPTSCPVAATTAVTFHRPTLERCWLLCSGESRSNAEALRAWLRGLDEPVESDDPVPVDPYDPLAVREAVDAIYRALPPDWQASDVIADYTGMTAHCSVGMVLACLDGSRRLEYTPQDPQHVGKSLPPIEIDITWEIAGLQPRAAAADQPTRA